MVVVMDTGRIDQADTGQRRSSTGPQTPYVARFMGGQNVLTGTVESDAGGAVTAEVGGRIDVRGRQGQTPATVGAQAVDCRAPRPDRAPTRYDGGAARRRQRHRRHRRGDRIPGQLRQGDARRPTGDEFVANVSDGAYFAEPVKWATRSSASWKTRRRPRPEQGRHRQRRRVLSRWRPLADGEGLTMATQAGPRIAQRRPVRAGSPTNPPVATCLHDRACRPGRRQTDRDRQPAECRRDGWKAEVETDCMQAMCRARWPGVAGKQCARRTTDRELDVSKIEDIADRTAAGIALAYRSGEATPGRIDRMRAGAHRQAPRATTSSSASQRDAGAARRPRRRKARYERGAPLSPLDGVPIAWKDLFDVAGSPTTAGSKLFARTARDARTWPAWPTRPRPAWCRSASST